MAHATPNQCKRHRDGGVPPHRIVVLPAETTNSKAFLRPEIPVVLCANCDGSTLENAIRAHDRRASEE